jgi:hypothetical protein
LRPIEADPRLRFDRRGDICDVGLVNDLVPGANDGGRLHIAARVA